MGFVDSQPPKYIPWDLLLVIRKAIKSKDKTVLDVLGFYIRAEYGIDWDRKRLDIHTGQIICEWFNDRNADRDFRE